MFSKTRYLHRYLLLGYVSILHSPRFPPCPIRSLCSSNILSCNKTCKSVQCQHYDFINDYRGRMQFIFCFAHLGIDQTDCYTAILYLSGVNKSLIQCEMALCFTNIERITPVSVMYCITYTILHCLHIPLYFRDYRNHGLNTIIQQPALIFSYILFRYTQPKLCCKVPVEKKEKLLHLSQ